MLHFPVPVNGAARPIDASIALPAQSVKHRPSRKKRLALLAADIRHGVIPAQKTLAGALGISVAMVSAAENLSPTERAAVAAGKRPLIMPTGLTCLPAPSTQLITDQALTEIVRAAGVDRVLAAVEPFLS